MADIVDVVLSRQVEQHEAVVVEANRRIQRPVKCQCAHINYRR